MQLKLCIGSFKSIGYSLNMLFFTMNMNENGADMKMLLEILWNLFPRIPHTCVFVVCVYLHSQFEWFVSNELMHECKIHTTILSICFVSKCA